MRGTRRAATATLEVGPRLTLTRSRLGRRWRRRGQQRPRRGGTTSTASQIRTTRSCAGRNSAARGLRRARHSRQLIGRKSGGGRREGGKEGGEVVGGREGRRVGGGGREATHTSPVRHQVFCSPMDGHLTPVHATRARTGKRPLPWHARVGAQSLQPPYLASAPRCWSPSSGRPTQTHNSKHQVSTRPFVSLVGNGETSSDPNFKRPVGKDTATFGEIVCVFA